MGHSQGITDTFSKRSHVGVISAAYSNFVLLEQWPLPIGTNNSVHPANIIDRAYQRIVSHYSLLSPCVRALQSVTGRLINSHMSIAAVAAMLWGGRER